MKFLHYSLCFLLLIMQIQSNDENNVKCEEYFKNIVDAISIGEMPKNVSPQTLLSSGKGLQDLGSYLVCRDSVDLHYIHLRMISGGRPLHMGFCLPQFCDMDYLQTFNETTKKFINNLTNLQFNRSMIESVSYQDPELMYPEWSVGTYLTLFLLIVVVGLNVIGSIFSIIAENKKKAYQDDLQIEIKNKAAQKINDSKIEETSFQSESINQLYRRSELIQNEIMENQESAFMSGQGQFEEIKYEKYKEATWERFALSFSFIHNYQKLFKINEPQGDNAGFVVFNGIRSLSIFWVIFGHDQLIRGSNSFNLIDIPYKITEPGWVTLTPAAYFAVDTFFFVGGFLAAVLLLEKLTKLRTIKFTLVPAMWLHRFLRIWPTYAFCILVYWQLTVYMSDGPIWNEYIASTSTCNTQWWKNLLFIDNMFSHANNGLSYCFGWGWYLSNDFQIFLITPILLIIYARNKKIGLTIIISLLIGSVFSAYYIAFSHDYHLQIGTPNAKPQPDYQDVFYYKPWVRISPYLIGILFGLFYRNYISGQNQKLVDLAKKIKDSVLIRTLLYLIGIGLTQTIIWIIIPLQKDMNAWPPQAQYFYQAFNRVFFVIGVGFCITPALLGCKNDPSRFILGHPFWQPIARISFCMYLTHFIVILFMTFSSTQLVYYQYSHILFFTLTDIVYTIVIGGILSLAIEVPCMNLEKILFAPKKQQAIKLNGNQVQDQIDL
ncbi:unnamed protein product [Paramecium primaurelia]|uniref:Acyltransferase 3 domain-containing protein n=1 Tax=Paramecium primaurelia TaxID=5886 RepID=A0A8S1PW16_PARPR|nr:unnamed protein product [Paramecium primaurelia]